MTVRRSIRLALLPLLALAALPVRAADAPIAWRDWDQGLREARQSGRPVMVEVCTDWGAVCKRMDREVHSRPEVREYVAGHFIPVRLDAEADSEVRYEGKDYTGRSLAARFRVTVYPTHVFLKPTGQHLISVPGHVPAERFQLVMRYVAEGHLERGVDWEEFRRKQAAGR